MSDETDSVADDDAARRKKLTGRLVWGFLIVSVSATIAWRIACGGSSSATSGKVQWRCVPEPPRDVVCVFESDVAAPGVCFDLVLTCEGTEHRTEVCSGRLEAGGRNDVDVGELTPPLPAKPVCGKPRYEHERDL